VRSGIRLVVVAAGVVLAAVVVLHLRGRPRYTDTQRARIVHDGATTVVVPRRRGTLLIVLLHGRGSNANQFLSDRFFAALDRPGAPVVVLPSGGNHSYWHDRRDGGYATRVLDSVIPDAVRRFHTRGKVAIGGISMGGYGAFHLAELRPGEFCAVGGHSAAVWTSAGATAPGAFDDADDYARNDVFAATRRLRGIPAWLDNGDRDPFRDADAELAKRLHVTQHVWPGGHEQAYWDAHIAQYLRFYEKACRTRAKRSAAT
jgi:enterochelin esterase-like enzyme